MRQVFCILINFWFCNDIGYTPTIPLRYGSIKLTSIGWCRSNFLFSQVFGNLFTLLCAVAYAMHIVLVERYVKNQNISQLMFVQSLTGAVLCLPLITFSEFEFLYENIFPIVFLGLVVNVGAFYLQLYGQKIIKASTSALILSMEAIFALLIGILVANEYLNILNWFGVLMVLLSIFLVVKE